MASTVSAVGMVAGASAVATTATVTEAGKFANLVGWFGLACGFKPLER
jgi:hypothetical protein